MIKVLHQMAHPGSEASSYYNLPPGSFAADFGAAAAVRDGWYACQNGIAKRSSDTVHTRQLENLKKQHSMLLASLSSQISSKNALLAKSASCLAQMRREFGELMEKERSSTVQAAAAQQQVSLLVTELRSSEAQLSAAVGCAQRSNKEAARARRAEQEARTALEAQCDVPSRTQVRHEAELERRRTDATAAERTAQLEQACKRLREGSAQALELIAGLESRLRSEQTRRGQATADLETARLKLAKVEEKPQDTTLRNQQRREGGLRDELDAARATVAELQTRVQQLAEMPLGQRGQEPSQAARPLQQVRTSVHADAPFSARSLEYMCRLVDESNGSFEGAVTANALVLGMHYGADVPDSMLYSAGTLRNAFHRVVIAAQEADAARNRTDSGPWCIAQDAGGGTLMVATGHWDAEAQRPEARPLAASDLFRDQGARNGINTLERAAERGGLSFGRCVGSCSDGTDHAVQESQGFCELTHERAKTLAGPYGQRAVARGRPLAQADFCCIHGKALEENSGMQAAFPDNYLVDALRLLWELVRGPEGRPAQYRNIWAEQVARADGSKLPALPVALFDQNLKALAEPTEAKWQVCPAACISFPSHLSVGP